MTSTTNIQYVTASAALHAIPGLSVLLGQASVQLCNRPWHKIPPHCAGVLVWGNKPSARKGEQLAVKHGLPLIRLEDGFLRSVALGIDSAPYSVVIDHAGIYYDARSHSDIESLIKNTLNDSQISRARHLIGLWQAERVSKYNHGREFAAPEQPYVLLVDQTFGDASIAYGLADAARFEQMLQSARETFPHHLIVLKTHPDVFAGKKQGHFDTAALAQQDNVLVLAQDIHAPALLQHASAVFCVTSQMGFEALLWQKPVYTFGMPFYAGWGLTYDLLPAPEQRCKVSLEQLVYAALIAYPRYIHPETHQLCQVEDLTSWMGLQRRHRERFAPKLYLGRVPRWKKALLRQFFQGSHLQFSVPEAELSQTENVIQWGYKRPANGGILVEDGFIRSVGLGADLTRPASWVLDHVGMYYDATAPSALELMLANDSFESTLLTRAAQLRQQLVALNVTKYNVGAASWRRPERAKVILVPGQVETDASIARGSPVLKTNQALLEAVRQQAPDAYIVYKPHPDVVAGLRKAGSADVAALTLYDELITDQDMAHLLTQVDEVHTLTSLTGFEALLRGLKVYCYGQPFYAGWGLTHDKYPAERRQRQRTIDELVAATLILYPTYISYRSGYFTTPEQVIVELQQQRKAVGSKLPWWRPVIRRVLALKKF